MSLSSQDRIRIATRLAEIKGRIAADNERENLCKEIGALRNDILKFDTQVRNSRLTETLSSTGVMMTVAGPFFLIGVPAAVIAGFVLTIAGPTIALGGWIANEDREVKLNWVKRMLDDIYELSLQLRCGEFR